MATEANTDDVVVDTMTDAEAEKLRYNGLDRCAPKFAAAVTALLADMAAQGHPSRIVETVRVQALQTHYFVQHTSNAASVLYSWHGYGLAADVVHQTQWWDAPAAYWKALGDTAERHGLQWGGDWKMHDTPHVQWGRCRVTPSGLARTLYVSGGLPAVWQAVGAA